jgi:hypothetical protein
VVKIKEVFKSPKAVLCLICLIAIVLLLVFSLFGGEEKAGLNSEPAHIVLNKWTDKYDRKRSICFNEIEKSATFRTSLESLPSSRTKLIFKTENLRFMLYAKGKIIFDNTDKKLTGYGEQIHIIDISDIKKKSEIFLYLAPIKNTQSRINSDILLTSKNDFVLEILSRNIKEILLCLLLFFCFVFFLVSGLIKLIKKKKTAPKMLYFSCCLGLLFLIFFLKCEPFLMITSGNALGYILLYSAYNLCGVFISAFLCSLLMLKSRFINCFIAANMLYSISRAALFCFFLIPLSNALFISHFLMIMSVILPIILKLCQIISRAFS